MLEASLLTYSWRQVEDSFVFLADQTKIVALEPNIQWAYY